MDIEMQLFLIQFHIAPNPIQVRNSVSKWGSQGPSHCNWQGRCLWVQRAFQKVSDLHFWRLKSSCRYNLPSLLTQFLRQIIHQGESLKIKFKKCWFQRETKSFKETIFTSTKKVLSELRNFIPLSLHPPNLKKQGIISLSFQYEDRIHVVSKDQTTWNFWKKYIIVYFCLKMDNLYPHREVHQEED